MPDSLSFEIHLNETYEKAVIMVTAALKEHGFGVLTNIDVKATLKEKIGADFRPYAILGVCNPKLAYRALSSRPEVGLMLPCNVTVEEDSDGGVTVRIIEPEAMLASAGMADDPELREVAAEAAELLGRVAGKLQVATRAKSV